jgi:hypothetical protein
MKALMLFSLDNKLHAEIVDSPSMQLINRAVLVINMDENTMMKYRLETLSNKPQDNDVILKRLFSPNQD